MENKETRLFCLRVMVGVIILFDHVDPIGAFQKKSAIDVSMIFFLFRLLMETSRALNQAKSKCGAKKSMCDVWR